MRYNSGCDDASDADPGVLKGPGGGETPGCPCAQPLHTGWRAIPLHPGMDEAKEGKEDDDVSSTAGGKNPVITEEVPEEVQSPEEVEVLMEEIPEKAEATLREEGCYLWTPTTRMRRTRRAPRRRRLC